MYRIIDERGTGKTSRLLLLAKETGATIVCKNPNAIALKAINYGITGVNVIGYPDLNKAEFDNKDILVDDLEEFAKYILLTGDPAFNLIGYNLSTN